MGTETKTGHEDDEGTGERCYCGGCGDRIVGAEIAATHGGVAYCRGCEDAPAEPIEPEPPYREPHAE